MAENSAIQWTDHTFNPWLGCTKVSPACDRCYAERWGKRFGVEWGHGQPRRRTSRANWRKPMAWDKAAAKSGIRPRVFCASLADVFDIEIDPAWRRDLFDLIEATPNLDWLLLTKRHAVPRKELPAAPWPHVRIGMTVEDQHWADIRMPRLTEIAHMGWKTFVSYEPACGEVNWLPWLSCGGSSQWIIAGAESGNGARPAPLEWFRDTRDACARAGVPFFMKQITGPTGDAVGEIDQFPADLRVRQFPAEKGNGDVSE